MLNLKSGKELLGIGKKSRQVVLKKLSIKSGSTKDQTQFSGSKIEEITELRMGTKS